MPRATAFFRHSFTCLQLASLLAKLHAAELMHGFLQPASLMWLPNKLDWAFANFGFAAPSGTGFGRCCLTQVSAICSVTASLADICQLKRCVACGNCAGYCT
jgi:hypothetical protein